ncbi:hypothetical protein SBP28_004236 [Candidozyma auris]
MAFISRLKSRAGRSSPGASNARFVLLDIESTLECSMYEAGVWRSEARRREIGDDGAEGAEGTPSEALAGDPERELTLEVLSFGGFKGDISGVEFEAEADWTLGLSFGGGIGSDSEGLCRGSEEEEEESLLLDALRFRWGFRWGARWGALSFLLNKNITS